LCAPGVSDSVFAFVGFRDLIPLTVLSKSICARIKTTAPIFRRLSICGWHLSLDNGARRFFGNGGVLEDKALFGFTNPTGLSSVSLSLSKRSLAALPWEAMTRYFNQIRSLRTLVLKEDTSEGNAENSSAESAQSVNVTAANALANLVSSLAWCSSLRLEWAPFTVDAAFVTNLSSMLQDVRLMDERIEWTEQFLTAVRSHFGSLSVFGFPASCIASISLPTLVSLLEDLVPALVIGQSATRPLQLNPQDLAMLFNRFESIEMDASLISEYPSTDNKTRITELSLKGDRHDFFISLLLNVPHSVTRLSIRNVQFSTNNLVVDVTRCAEFNTKAVRSLSLFDFDNNLKQIAAVINNNLFPNLERLMVATSMPDKRPRVIEAQLKKLVRTSNLAISAKTYDPDLE